jgi:NADPH:quinone reductase
MMRALVVRVHGEPAEVLRPTSDEAVPAPGPGEVVVRVEACALNFADDLLCRGTYQETPALPFTPGLEIAGEVVAAGAGVAHEIGSRVAGSTRLPHGGLAEYAVAGGQDVFPVPDDVPAVDAAAMHVTYQTAWFALRRRAGLRRDETLLVHAGAGGAGSAAIQLGKALGARVVATAGGSEKVELCLRLGADLAVDYRTEDFVTTVNETTDGRGADVIFDPVGGDTFERSRRCIAWEGRLLVIGAAGGRYFDAPTNHILVKNYSVVGVHWGGYRTRNPDLVAQAHAELVDLHAAGAITPLVSQVVSLDDAVPALDSLTAGRTVGKVVVIPSDGTVQRPMTSSRRPDGS